MYYVTKEKGIALVKSDVIENIGDDILEEKKWKIKRLDYLDNIRWITVVLVIIYHIIYLFNNSGVISNIGVKGIQIMDTFLIFVYPWFMCLLFIVSGISCNYSLRKRNNKEFIKRSCKKEYYYHQF